MRYDTSGAQLPRLIRPVPDPLGLYLRVGRNDHRDILNLVSQGKLGCFGLVSGDGSPARLSTSRCLAKDEDSAWTRFSAFVAYVISL
jgi:hypothetical protein